MDRISVFGLGYVGTVCAACLAGRGHRVIGVDNSETKVKSLASGHSPIIEDEVDELIAKATASGALTSTLQVAEAIETTDLSIVCVGTPSLPNGGVSLDALQNVSAEIGSAIRSKAKRHTVVVRSTVLPGTTRGLINEQICKAAGNVPYGLAFNPEFLREGTAVADFNNPSKTVVSALDGETATEVMSLYEEFPGLKIITDIETAEMVKYVHNAWNALKVVFANEIGAISKSLGINSHDVMDIFAMDRRLSISPAYLRPGFAFGGPCLPKDLRALTHLARKLDLELPVMSHVQDSNRLMIERGAEWILHQSDKRVGFLGISFKPGTDDTRESPFVELVERTVGKGREVRIFDPNINPPHLIGANRDYLVRTIPHIRELMVQRAAEVVAWADTIVVTARDPRYASALNDARPDQVVLDFAYLNGVAPEHIKVNGFLW